MIEFGQPLHAYDLSRLAGGITRARRKARRARRRCSTTRSTRSTPSSWSSRTTAARSASPASWAAGTPRSATGTTDVLLEAAHFTPDAIAGRARRLGLFTDAAQRFERGVDPSLPALALERATALLLEIAGGEPGPAQVTRGAVEAGAARDWVRLRRELA